MPGKMPRPSGAWEMPRSTRRWAGTPTMSSPLNVMRPLVTGRSPEIVVSVVDLPAPLIAVGEVAGQVAGPAADADVVEQALGLLASLTLLAAVAGRADQGARDARAVAGVGADDDVLQGGDVGEQADVLERARHPRL